MDTDPHSEWLRTSDIEKTNIAIMTAASDRTDGVAILDDATDDQANIEEAGRYEQEDMQVIQQREIEWYRREKELVEKELRLVQRELELLRMSWRNEVLLVNETMSTGRSSQTTNNALVALIGIMSKNKRNNSGWFSL